MSAELEMCLEALEIRWYAQLGILRSPTEPETLDASHGPSESIDEAGMRRCAAVYTLYASTMLS